MVSELTGKTFAECYVIYGRACDSAIRVTALCAMMNKASTKAELEIVRSLAHPKSVIHAQANERLELLNETPCPTPGVGQGVQ
ncbi:MAG: hypothetical protein Q8Q95_02670 [bacterium]|nr:hypothetical protein [bacterium]